MSGSAHPGSSGKRILSPRERFGRAALIALVALLLGPAALVVAQNEPAPAVPQPGTPVVPAPDPQPQPENQPEQPQPETQPQPPENLGAEALAERLAAADAFASQQQFGAARAAVADFVSTFAGKASDSVLERAKDALAAIVNNGRDAFETVFRPRLEAARGPERARQLAIIEDSFAGFDDVLATARMVAQAPEPAGPEATPGPEPGAQPPTPAPIVPVEPDGEPRQPFIPPEWFVASADWSRSDPTMPFITEAWMTPLRRHLGAVLLADDDARELLAGFTRLGVAVTLQFAEGRDPERTWLVSGFVPGREGAVMRAALTATSVERFWEDPTFEFATYAAAPASAARALPAERPNASIGDFIRRLHLPLSRAVVFWFAVLLTLLVALDFRRLISVRTLDALALLLIYPFFFFLSEPGGETVALSGIFALTGYFFVRLLLESGRGDRPGDRYLPRNVLWLLLLATVAFNVYTISVRAPDQSSVSGALGADFLKRRHPTGQTAGKDGKWEMRVTLPYDYRYPLGYQNPEIGPSPKGDFVGGRDLYGPVHYLVHLPAEAVPFLSARMTLGNETKPVHLETYDRLKREGYTLRLPGAKVTLLLFHLLGMLGLFLIGRQFHSDGAGLVLAIIYGISPYVAEGLNSASQVIPVAFVIWAVYARRNAYYTGILLALGTGVMFYPAFLAPLFLGYYLRNDWRKFFVFVFGGLAIFGAYTAAGGSRLGSVSPSLAVACLSAGLVLLLVVWIVGRGYRQQWGRFIFGFGLVGFALTVWVALATAPPQAQQPGELLRDVSVVPAATTSTVVPAADATPPTRFEAFMADRVRAPLGTFYRSIRGRSIDGHNAPASLSIWSQHPALQELGFRRGIWLVFLAVALLLAFVPERANPYQLMALAAALCAATQLFKSHAGGLYVTWWLSLAVPALFLPLARRGTSAARELRQRGLDPHTGRIGGPSPTQLETMLKEWSTGRAAGTATVPTATELERLIETWVSSQGAVRAPSPHDRPTARLDLAALGTAIEGREAGREAKAAEETQPAADDATSTEPRALTTPEEQAQAAEAGEIFYGDTIGDQALTAGQLHDLSQAATATDPGAVGAPAPTPWDAPEPEPAPAELVAPTPAESAFAEPPESAFATPAQPATFDDLTKKIAETAETAEQLPEDDFPELPPRTKSYSLPELTADDKEDGTDGERTIEESGENYDEF